MSDYTPVTIEDVRDAYAGAYHAGHNYHQGTAEFDRWLASVKAEAWGEGFKYAAFTEGYLDELEEENPYRKEQ